MPGGFKQLAHSDNRVKSRGIVESALAMRCAAWVQSFPHLRQEPAFSRPFSSWAGDGSHLLEGLP